MEIIEMKRTATLLIVIVSVCVGWLLMSSLDRAAITFSSGDVRRGGALGVEIGASRSRAVGLLTAGGMVVRPQTHMIACEADDSADGMEYDLLVDPSWRWGTVCLGSDDDKISRISWRFYPLGFFAI